MGIEVVFFFFPPPWFSANVKPFNISCLCCRAEQCPRSGHFPSDCTRLYQTIARHKCFVQRCFQSPPCVICSPALAVSGLLSSLLLLCFFFPSVPAVAERAVLIHFAVCLVLKEQQSNYPQFSAFCLEIKCGSGRNITTLCKNKWTVRYFIALLLWALLQRRADRFQFSLE